MGIDDEAGVGLEPSPQGIEGAVGDLDDLFTDSDQVVVDVVRQVPTGRAMTDVDVEGDVESLEQLEGARDGGQVDIEAWLTPRRPAVRPSGARRCGRAPPSPPRWSTVILPPETRIASMASSTRFLTTTASVVGDGWVEGLGAEIRCAGDGLADG